MTPRLHNIHRLHENTQNHCTLPPHFLAIYCIHVFLIILDIFTNRLLQQRFKFKHVSNLSKNHNIKVKPLPPITRSSLFHNIPSSSLYSLLHNPVSFQFVPSRFFPQQHWPNRLKWNSVVHHITPNSVTKIWKLHK